MTKRWTPEEDSIIIRSGRKAEVNERTPIAVQNRYYYLVGCGEIALKEKQVRWTNEEHELLYCLKNDGMKWADIAIELNRSIESCKTHYKRGYGFSTLGYNDWSDDRLLDLVRKYKGKEVINYYRSEGEPSAGVIERRFGSWSKAMIAAGVPLNLGELKLDAETVLYLVDFVEFKKIGITQRSVEDRFRGYASFTLLDSVKFEDAISAWETEQELLKLVKSVKFVPEGFGGGKTECFKLDCSNLLDLYAPLSVS